MIKKENRLSGKRIVGKVISKGSSFRTEFFSCRILPSRSQSVRMTVVVSKKVSPQAVVRNKIKRRVREAFDNQIGSACGRLIVVFPNRLSLEAPFDKLQEEAKKCLETRQ